MVFIYHILKAVFSEQSFAHVGAERQTNIQTYIHTNTHTFRKTISVNQACFKMMTILFTYIYLFAEMHA